MGLSVCNTSIWNIANLDVQEAQLGTPGFLDSFFADLGHDTTSSHPTEPGEGLRPVSIYMTSIQPKVFDRYQCPGVKMSLVVLAPGTYRGRRVSASLILATGSLRRAIHPAQTLGRAPLGLRQWSRGLLR